MRNPHVDDRVRLTKSVPDTELACGQVGIVCSVWSTRTRPLYEVEFTAHNDVCRALLTREQITLDDQDDEDTALHGETVSHLA